MWMIMAVCSAVFAGLADKILRPDYARRSEETYKTTTAAQLHMIEGSAHSFSKKHDIIARDICEILPRGKTEN